MNARLHFVALASFSSLLASASAQAPATPQSAAYPFEQLTVRKSENGAESRNVLRATLATGETVAVHESMQPPNIQPVPLHTIQHSEVILVQEGTVAFDHDGKTDTVSAGSALYVAFGTLHRVRNVGQTPAKYFVVRVGGDTAPTPTLAPAAQPLPTVPEPSKLTPPPPAPSLDHPPAP